MLFRLFRYRHIYIPLLLLWVVGVILISNTFKGQEVLYVETHRNHFWNAIFGSVTQLAEFPVYAIIVVLLWLSNRREKALTVMIAGLITIFVSGGFKEIFQEPRPAKYFETTNPAIELPAVPGIALHRGRNSYPSGHSMGAFTLFVTLGYLWPRQRIFGVLCVMTAATVAFSRIYLGQHFLTDIVAGSLVGTYIASFSYFVIFKKILKIKTKKHLT